MPFIPVYHSGAEQLTGSDVHTIAIVSACQRAIVAKDVDIEAEGSVRVS